MCGRRVRQVFPCSCQLSPACPRTIFRTFERNPRSGWVAWDGRPGRPRVALGSGLALLDVLLRTGHGLAGAFAVQIGRWLSPLFSDWRIPWGEGDGGPVNLATAPQIESDRSICTAGDGSSRCLALRLTSLACERVCVCVCVASSGQVAMAVPGERMLVGPRGRDQAGWEDFPPQLVLSPPQRRSKTQEQTDGV